MQPGADVERAYALGRVYLVPGNGHHVRAEALDCEGHLEKALHRVAVEQDLRGRLFKRASKAGDVVHRPGLIVHEHEGDKHRVGPERVQHRLHRHRAARIRRKARDLVAPALQLVERFAHGVVFGHGADDVSAPGGGGPGAGEQGPVVRLGAAGGKGELLRLAAEAEGELPARGVEQLFRFAPARVRGAGVAVLLRHHPVCHVCGLGTDPGSGRVVQIDVQIITFEVLLR